MDPLLLLIEKLAAGTATAAEQQQWLQWLDHANEAEYRRLMQEWAARCGRLSATDELPADAVVFNTITRELIARQALGTTMEPRIVRMRARRRRWFLYAGAAVVLLALIGGVFLYQQQTGKASGSLAVVSDKAPGGNKAVLTLADGSKVILDSNGSHAIADQAGMKVLQTGNGQLAYELNGAVADTSGAVSFNTLETPRGGQFRVVLPDGSRVWLNSASSLRYPTVMKGGQREVVLQGEAYFEIAENKAKPFIVHAANQNVMVLGTDFNINAYSNEDAVRTTLLTGSVRIEKQENPALAKVLMPGEQAVTGYQQTTIALAKPDLAEVTAWKNGEFRFHNMPITALMRQIERWYDVEVVYQGPVPTAEFYGVIPRKEYVSQLLKALALTKNVHFKTLGNKIIVMTGPD